MLPEASKKHTSHVQTANHDHGRQLTVYVVAIVILPAPIDLVLLPPLLAAVFVRTETLLERYHQCLPSKPDADIPRAHSQGYLEISTFGLKENGRSKRDRCLWVPKKKHPDFS